MLDAQIFIVTCEADLGWLECCLRSIRKFWVSDYSPVILADDRCISKIHAPGCVVGFLNHSSDGRRDQVVSKLKADEYTEAPLVMYLDSDCMLMQPCSLESLIGYTAGDVAKPPIYCKQYSKIVEDIRIPESVRDVYRGYQKVVSECLWSAGVTFEYMQRFPFIFHTDTISSTRRRIEHLAKKDLWDVACEYPSNHFSEFNLLGAYAHMHERDRYNFVQPIDNSVHPHYAYGPPTVRQFDARSQSVESQREEIDFILGG